MLALVVKFLGSKKYAWHNQENIPALAFPTIVTHWSAKRRQQSDRPYFKSYAGGRCLFRQTIYPVVFLDALFSGFFLNCFRTNAFLTGS
jgi:hypothetical protein